MQRIRNFDLVDARSLDAVRAPAALPLDSEVSGESLAGDVVQSNVALFRPTDKGAADRVRQLFVVDQLQTLFLLFENRQR